MNTARLKRLILEVRKEEKNRIEAESVFDEKWQKGTYGLASICPLLADEGERLVGDLEDIKILSDNCDDCLSEIDRVLPGLGTLVERAESLIGKNALLRARLSIVEEVSDPNEP